MNLIVEYHASQWPHVVAPALCESLERGVVPGRWLYDSPAQSARWLAYHEGWSPARTSDDVQRQYDAAFHDALDDLPEGPLQYVSIGCGGGQKDARFVGAAAERSVQVILTDTSPSLVLTASRAVEQTKARSIRRIVLDLSAWPERGAYGVSDGAPVVWSCLGILPNFEHDRLLPYLASLMEPADRLILSANHSPASYEEARDRIVPQYDNDLARRWYDGALVELGCALPTTERRLTSEALEAGGEIWRVRYHAIPSEPAALEVHGRLFTLPAGRRLHVFQSTRYTPERMPALFDAAGLTRRVSHVDASREEGVYVLSVAAL